MGWNHKSEKAGWWFLFFLPLIPAIAVMILGPFFPFVHRHPVLSCILFGVLFLIGLVIVWKRAGKKDRQE